MDIVKPSLVVTSGDLVDSRTPGFNRFGSDQYEKEWMWYSEALTSSGIRQKTVYLDMRGNHGKYLINSLVNVNNSFFFFFIDTFNVFRWNSTNNYFKNYSESGPRHQRHFRQLIKKDNQIYKFIIVDPSLEPGPKRPYNFFGYLEEEDISMIKGFVNDSHLSVPTVWLSHYPTSSIYDETNSLRTLVNGPWLCGHFHTVFRLVPKMYIIQNDGFLEIELADWMDQRAFRVAAIDHGIFSFVDVKLDQWPIVLITNPKAAHFMTSYTEPIDKIAQSTHIRVLIFSMETINQVFAQIDNDQELTLKLSNNSHLYTGFWRPELLSSGLHTIKIRTIVSD